MKTLKINDRCSKYFTYSDLIECGDTYKKYSNIDNIPNSNETFKAIDQLCQQILDPIHDKYGKVVLTYGFASQNLTKKIKKDIYPKLDQHSGYEKNKKGNYICKRLGMACDFYVENINSYEVARFIVQKLPFDRLYFYERDRPLHVSIGPENKKLIVKMTKLNNRKIPKVIKEENFINGNYI